jgi:hypothetical protein
LIQGGQFTIEALFSPLRFDTDGDSIRRGKLIASFVPA